MPGYQFARYSRPERPLPPEMRRPGPGNLRGDRSNAARLDRLRQRHGLGGDRGTERDTGAAQTGTAQTGTTQTGTTAAGTTTAGSGDLEQVLAIDMSHWSGAPTQSDVDAWKAAGVEHAIVGTQDAEITAAQLEMLQANGLTTDAYTYLYFNRDMTEQVVTAFDRIEGYACGVMWLDIEDSGSASGFTVDELVAKVQEAVDAAQTEITRRELDMEVGIYTSWGFWTDVMGNSTAFSDLPLWYAHWDGEADFEDWADLPFGGWDESMIRGKQYAGDTYVAGADPIVDLNTMLVPSTAPQEEAALVDHDQLVAQLDALLAGGSVEVVG